VCGGDRVVEYRKLSPTAKRVFLSRAAMAGLCANLERVIIDRAWRIAS